MSNTQCGCILRVTVQAAWFVVAWAMYLTPVARGDEIYNSLCITEEYMYEGGWPNHCGGDGVFGESFDFQAADDFRIERGHFITRVTADYLTALGLEPEKVCLGFYRESDEYCGARDDAFHTQEVPDDAVVVEPFKDKLFGAYGQRIILNLGDPPRLPASRWYMNMQPSSPDYSWQVRMSAHQECFDDLCDLVSRNGGERNPCCDGGPLYGGDWYDWRHSGQFEPISLAMKIEGIPTGDCTGGEAVAAACKPRRDGTFNLVVKVRNGLADGSVAALLDPPDPQSIRIPLDDSGRGKGKFKRIAAGSHRVLACDSAVDVICTP